jgi:predicted GNAT family acetyltransferase
VEVTHNESAHRFEHGSARLEYIRRGDRVFMTHTEVPEEFEGKGVASALARTALDWARQENLKVVPRCPFVKKYLERHPEYSNLVE